MKKTKIVATIGPASEYKETLRTMIREGMNVARLNFSHGDHAWHEHAIAAVRAAEKEERTHVGILADLQGPRIRTIMPAPLEIVSGEQISVTDRTDGRRSIAKEILLDCPGIVARFAIGHEILIEDGLMRLRVEEVFPDHVVVRVVDGGTIQNHKGVNVPQTDVPLPTLTEKDEKDLRFALGQNIDFIGLSFVRSAQDIQDVRKRMRAILGREKHMPHIIAKIERREAMEHLSEIVIAADAVMVARGDLGIEMDESQVVLFQKRIIAESLRTLTPVIVATQMLQSMITNPRPTRAEVSDVTNAVIDHTDAVMLSGETTNGRYPLESIRAMRAIIERTEESPFDDVRVAPVTEKMSEHVRMVRSAVALAREAQAEAIVAFSASGYTARLLSHFRPERRLLVVTDNPLTYRQLSLVWGVEAFFDEGKKTPGDFVEGMIRRAITHGMFRKGQQVVVVLGGAPGSDALTLVGLHKIV
ncbi:MAG TPA: pyruvate kinase [Patescibacteria group bacterium]|nr:pyruvate kinase [Patescibacteria group bacterium]